MATAKELVEQRLTLHNKMKAFLDENAQENGTLSARDDEVYAKMEKEFDDLSNAIDRQKRIETRDSLLEQPMNKRILDNPAIEKIGKASDEYKRDFWNMMRAQKGCAVITNALQEGTDSEGGYLCPEEFEQTLINKLQEENVLRTMAKVIQTTGDRKIPVVSSNSTAYLVEEEASFTESDPAFTQVMLGAYKIGTVTKASYELLYDSAFDLQTFIAEDHARAIGAKEEALFINGTGSGQPTGLLASSGGAQTGVTAASATKITADEVLDLIYSVKAPYRRNAQFLMNDMMIKAVRKLKDGTGTYLWQPALTMGEPDRLMGYPVKTSAAMPDTIQASAKTIAFGDFNYFWVADRGVRQFKRLEELFSMNGQIGFQGWARVDGRLILPEAIKVLVQAAS